MSGAAAMEKNQKGQLLLGLDRRLVPLAGTLVLFVAMIIFGALSYRGFLAPQVFLNLVIDNAFLLIVAALGLVCFGAYCVAEARYRRL